jgi:hypothetical protein
LSAPTSSNELNAYASIPPEDTDQGIFSDADDGDLIKRTNLRNISRLQGTAPDFSINRSYNENDLVKSEGIIWRALAGISAGAFDYAEWQRVGTFFDSNVMADNSTQITAALPNSANGNLGAILFVQSFSTSGQITNGEDVFFKPDGLLMFVCGSSSNKVSTFQLTESFDISTANSTPIENFVGNFTGMYIREDGRKAYFQSTASVTEYDLDTPWVVNAGNLTLVFTFNTTSEGANAQAVSFKPDGTKMYVLSSTSTQISQYNLSIPWNVESAVFDNIFLDTSSFQNDPMGMYFSQDGKKIYIVGDVNNEICKIPLATPWDIESNQEEEFVVITNDAADPTGIFLKDDLSKLYVTNGANSEIVQFVVGTTANQLLHGTINVGNQINEPSPTFIGFDYHTICRLASTEDIDIFTGGFITVDGVVTGNNFRVLVKDQDDPTENGIYRALVGTWVRANDADTNGEVIAGTSVIISEGTVNAGRTFYVTTPDPIDIGTTPTFFIEPLFATFANLNVENNFTVPQTITSDDDAEIPLTITIPIDNDSTAIEISNVDGSLVFGNHFASSASFAGSMTCTNKGTQSGFLLTSTIPVAEDFGSPGTALVTFDLFLDDNSPVLTRPLFEIENDDTPIYRFNSDSELDIFNPNGGSDLNLHNRDGSRIVSDNIGRLRFFIPGTPLGEIRCIITDTTPSAEDGALNFLVTRNTVPSLYMSLNGLTENINMLRDVEMNENPILNTASVNFVLTGIAPPVVTEPFIGFDTGTNMILNVPTDDEIRFQIGNTSEEYRFTSTEVDFNDNGIADLGPLQFTAFGTALTVTSNEISPTRTYHTVDTSGQNEIVKTITAGTTGDVVIFSGTSNTNTLTFDQTGNIRVGGGITAILDDVADMIGFIYDGNNWNQLFFSDNN